MNKPNYSTTLGWSLFYCPTGGACSLGCIRQRLELKYAACAATGGTNGFPLDVRRIDNPRLRQISAAGMACRGWSARDLTEYAGALEGPASSVLLATLNSPVWGKDDLSLLGLLEKMERLQTLAWKGDRIL